MSFNQNPSDHKWEILLAESFFLYKCANDLPQIVLQSDSVVARWLNIFEITINIDHQFRCWNCLFKKMELELINFELELKFPTKQLNPQNNLPFNFLIQEYFFHDNPTWNINYSK